MTIWKFLFLTRYDWNIQSDSVAVVSKADLIHFEKYIAVGVGVIFNQKSTFCGH